MIQDDMIAAARSMIGTPFKHQGRIPGVALDCAGLIVCSMRKCGLSVDDQSGYSRLPRNRQLESAVDSQSVVDRVSDRQAGDIFLMRFNKDPQHLAIFTGENIIHSWQIPGQVVEHRLDEDWAQRIVSIYRVNHG